MTLTMSLMVLEGTDHRLEEFVKLHHHRSARRSLPLKSLSRAADGSDVDVETSQRQWAAPMADGRPRPPMLPPQVDQVEQELVQVPMVTRPDEHTARQGPELIGTSATRVLAAAGWTGSAVGYTIAAIALSKSYRHITGQNWHAAPRLDPLADAVDDLVVRDGVPGLGRVGDVGRSQRSSRGSAGVLAVPPARRLPRRPRCRSLRLDLQTGAQRLGGWPPPSAGCASAMVFVLLSLRSSARRRIGADRRRVHQADLVPAGLTRLPADRHGGAAARRASTTPRGSQCWS